MKIYRLAWQLFAAMVAYASLAQATEPAVLTLDAAIRQALVYSPKVKSADAAKSASEGELLQAGYYANPEIGLEAENIGGSGDYKGFRGAEVTYGISQRIETGGKRLARKDIATQARTLSEYDLHAVRLDVVRDVTVAYIQAVAADAKVEIAREEKTFAAEVLKTVSSRVQAAADPLYLKSKAEVADTASAINLAKAERENRTAYHRLEALLGSSDRLMLDRTALSVLSPAGGENVGIAENPDIKRYAAAEERDRAAYALEKANALPDPSLNIGVRDLRDSGDQAFVVGVSLPIPVFQANDGNIRKARFNQVKTEADKQLAEIELAAQLMEHRQQMEEAKNQAERLRKEVIPSAEKAFEQARYGYGLGKFPYLEVLDGQRTLFDTREQYIASLLQYHLSRAEVERLTALHLPAIEALGNVSQEIPHVE